MLLTLFLGLFFIVGVLITKYSKFGEIIEHISISIALGAMIGIAVFDIIPEILEMVSASKYYLPIVGTIAGFLILAVLDKFIPEHEDEDDEEYSSENMEHIGIISTIAIVLHNIIEGMAVYSLTLTSYNQGLNLMLGIGLHNIPMGMFLYSTLKTQSKLSRRLFLALCTFSTFLGGIIMRFIEPFITNAFNTFLYGIALGMILFIVSMELFPYVKKSKNHASKILGVIIGLVVVFISVMFE